MKEERYYKAIKEAIEWIEWYREDNKDFFKEDKLTPAELDGLLIILKGALYDDKLDYCNRINKAINYINKYKFKGIESIKDRYLDNKLSEELLNILKGE